MYHILVKKEEVGRVEYDISFHYRPGGSAGETGEDVLEDEGQRIPLRGRRGRARQEGGLQRGRGPTPPLDQDVTVRWVS